MTNDKRSPPINDRECSKPYAMLGAGPLTAALWKTGDIQSGWRYRFNVYRLNNSTGRVSQRFYATDVKHLVRLAAVLAFALVDDGCLPEPLRQELRDLATHLDDAIKGSSHTARILKPTNRAEQPTPGQNGAAERESSP